MKKIVFAILAVFCLFCPASAQKTKHYLIFQGPSGEERALDVDQYNRIKFGKECIQLSKSNNPDQTLDLLYSVYDRFRIEKNAPLVNEELVAGASGALVYDSAVQSLKITGDTQEAYTLGIFNLNGVLLDSVTVMPGESVSVQSLSDGFYIAVAVNSTSSLTLKFVK